MIPLLEKVQLNTCRRARFRSRPVVRGYELKSCFVSLGALSVESHGRLDQFGAAARLRPGRA